MSLQKSTTLLIQINSHLTSVGVDASPGHRWLCCLGYYFIHEVILCISNHFLCLRYVARYFYA
jgi:hypothetical protein